MGQGNDALPAQGQHEKTGVPDKLAYAAHLREAGHSIADIVTKTGITRTSLYRHLPPRAVEQLTAVPGTERVAPEPAA